MISAVLIMSGFRDSIIQQLVGIDSHISIKNFDSNNSYESKPITIDSDSYLNLQNISGIKSISTFASKPAILKTKSDIHGIIVKGVGKEYDFDYLKSSLVEGRMIKYKKKGRSNEILISKRVAKMLNLKLGDKVSVYFVQNPPRARRFTICGIYQTNLVKFYDELFVIADIGHIKKLNKWKKNQVSGYEIKISDYDKIDKLERQVRRTVPNILEDGSALRIASIKKNYFQIFEWFSLIDINVLVTIGIALFLAIFNICGSVLVLVLEQTKSIGILKAIGAKNKQIRQIFILQSLKLLKKGLIYGNIAALTICFIQQQFEIISLNPATYFIDKVPIKFDIISILGLNAIVVVFVSASLLVPTLIISKIRVSKTIKFD
jgi:lipoprotein-releasing system permease protein